MENQDEIFMLEALKEAELAAIEDEVPVGAIIVRNGEILVRAHNTREKDKNALYHAEIKAIKVACQGKILKVIIETSLLTDEEKVVMCDIISKGGADYIKTSTGFSSAGATLTDIDLFMKHIYNGVRIKASGGIKTFEQAEEFLAHGADRLGTSSLIKLLKSN